MSARRNTGSSRRRLSARVVLGSAAAVGAAVLGTGTADARPVSLTLKYVCAFPVVGGHSVTMKVNANVPRSTVVGESTPKFMIHGVASVVDSTTAQALSQVGVKTVDGTVDAAATVVAPQGDTHISVRFKLARTEIPTSGPFDLEATAKAPAVTFRRPGHGQIAVGDLILHLVPKAANGNPILGTVDAPCRLESGQRNVLMSFDITSATHSAVPGPTHSATPGPTHSATPQPTDSAALGPTRPADPGPPYPTTPGTIRPTPVGATDGVGRTPLIALGVGALVAGATAFYLVSRFNHRRSGGG